jgi:hypothetical protein
MRAHTITTTKLALLLSLLALGALGLVACGGGDDDETAAPSATETTDNRTTDDALAVDKRSCGTFGRWRLTVVEGDISCPGTRRVMRDLAHDGDPPASWICSGPDGRIVCYRGELGASSGIEFTARF